MSDKRTDGSGVVHGEVVNGLLGLQARLRAESAVAVDRTPADGVGVTEGDLTVRMPAAELGRSDVASLAERIKRLEGLLDDVERKIGEFDRAVSSPPRT